MNKPLQQTMDVNRETMDENSPLLSVFIKAFNGLTELEQKKLLFQIAELKENRKPFNSGSGN